MSAPADQPLDRLGSRFRRDLTEPTAEQYRALVREHSEKALDHTHGPTADRHATVSTAYAIAALSKSIEEADHG